MLDRMLEIFKNKNTPKQEENKDADLALKKRLKSFLYDDALVEELFPTFKALEGVKGFEEVVELLETKEKQIEAISQGEWFKQETRTEGAPEEEQEEPPQYGDLVGELLQSKFGEK